MKNRVISYPKCGRTWFRSLIGKSICDKNNIDDKIIFDDKKVHKQLPGFPHFHHSYPSGDRYYEGYDEKKDILMDDFCHDNILLLIRDPRDVVMSFYLYATKNKSGIRTAGSKMPKDISFHDYLRFKKIGIVSIINFYKSWNKYSEKADNFKIIRYEDLHNICFNSVKSSLSFFGFNDVSDDNINASKKFSKFNSMRKKETTGYFNSNRFNSDKFAPIDSLKTRVGKIGSYKKEIDKSDVEYISEKMKSMNCPFYGVQGNE
jgi:hypothetical protein